MPAAQLTVKITLFDGPCFVSTPSSIPTGVQIRCSATGAEMPSGRVNRIALIL